MNDPIRKTREQFSIDGCNLDISALKREGNREPIVFLHGFGSSKEDYADISRYTEFDGHAVLAYDAPGCGETICDDLSKLSIPFLVKTAFKMLEFCGIEKFHLIGHSMGGLTALMLADAHPDRVLSLTSIEGNITPEDCFLSRQIISHSDPDPQKFLEGFIERASNAPAYASALFASNLRHKVSRRSGAGDISLHGGFV